MNKLKANSSFASTAVTGAITILFFFLVGIFSDVEIPAAVSSAFTTVLAAVVGYVTSDSPESGSGSSSTMSFRS